MRALLGRVLPADVLQSLAPELAQLGARAATDIAALGDEAEASPPRHEPYDAWGKRVDRIELHEARRMLQRVSAGVALRVQRTVRVCADAVDVCGDVARAAALGFMESRSRLPA